MGNIRSAAAGHHYFMSVGTEYATGWDLVETINDGIRSVGGKVKAMKQRYVLYRVPLPYNSDYPIVANAPIVEGAELIATGRIGVRF